MKHYQYPIRPESSEEMKILSLKRYGSDIQSRIHAFKDGWVRKPKTVFFLSKITTVFDFR